MDGLKLPELSEQIEQEQSGVYIPVIDKLDDTSNLISNDVEDAIKQKVVKTALLNTTDNIIIPAYLIDLSQINLIMQCVLEGLKSMIAPDNKGDTAIYILNPNNNLVLAGKGIKQDLYQVLEPYIEAVFGDKAKVYINNGKGFKKIKKLAVDSVVLDI